MSSVDHHELALVLLGRQRNLEAKPTYLLLQVECVRAHHRPENARTAAELRRSQAALAGATRPLLLVGLFGGSPDFPDPLSFVSTGATPSQLPIDYPSKNFAAGQKPQNLVSKFYISDLLLVAISNERLYG